MLNLALSIVFNEKNTKINKTYDTFLLLKVFTKVHVKSSSFVRKAKIIYFRIWIVILSSVFEYDFIAAILNFLGFDGKVVEIQFFCSGFDNYEGILF